MHPGKGLYYKLTDPKYPSRYPEGFPQYKDTDRDEYPEGPAQEFVVPPGMTPHDAWELRKAYYAEKAAPNELGPDETAASKQAAVDQYTNMYGKLKEPGEPDSAAKPLIERGSTKGFVPHSEIEGQAEKPVKQETRLDDPEIHQKFAEFLEARYPKGVHHDKMPKVAAEFLRDPNFQGDTNRVSPRLVESFLNYDAAGKKKNLAKPYTKQQLRRIDEIEL